MEMESTSKPNPKVKNEKTTGRQTPIPTATTQSPIPYAKSLSQRQIINPKMIRPQTAAPKLKTQRSGISILNGSKPYPHILARTMSMASGVGVTSKPASTKPQPVLPHTFMKSHSTRKINGRKRNPSQSDRPRNGSMSTHVLGRHSSSISLNEENSESYQILNKINQINNLNDKNNTANKFVLNKGNSVHQLFSRTSLARAILNPIETRALQQRNVSTVLHPAGLSYFLHYTFHTTENILFEIVSFKWSLLF